MKNQKSNKFFRVLFAHLAITLMLAFTCCTHVSNTADSDELAGMDPSASAEETNVGDDKASTEAQSDSDAALSDDGDKEALAAAEDQNAPKEQEPAPQITEQKPEAPKVSASNNTANTAVPSELALDSTSQTQTTALMASNDTKPEAMPEAAKQPSPAESMATETNSAPQPDEKSVATEPTETKLDDAALGDTAPSESVAEATPAEKPAAPVADSKVAPQVAVSSVTETAAASPVTEEVAQDATGKSQIKSSSAEKPREVATASNNSMAPEIPSHAVTQGNISLNRWYALRAGDNAEKVSQTLYGNTDRAKDLKRWNREGWQPGQVVFFSSPSQPQDTSMKGAHIEGRWEASDYQVQSGDTLSSIAQQKYGSAQSWREIALENQVADPDHIRVGQPLKLYAVHDHELTEAKPISKAAVTAAVQGRTLPLAEQKPVAKAATKTAAQRVASNFPPGTGGAQAPVGFVDAEQNRGFAAVPVKVENAKKPVTQKLASTDDVVQLIGQYYWVILLAAVAFAASVTFMVHRAKKAKAEMMD